MHYEATVPTIRDRVVQGALKLILEPIFEADFQPGSFGYRPKKSAHAAIQRVSQAILEGKTYVVDFDLRTYFDTSARYKLGLLPRRVRPKFGDVLVEERIPEIPEHAQNDHFSRTRTMNRLLLAYLEQLPGAVQEIELSSGKKVSRRGLTVRERRAGAADFARVSSFRPENMESPGITVL